MPGSTPAPLEFNVPIDPYNLNAGDVSGEDLDLLTIYKESLPLALTDAAIVAAVRTHDTDALVTGLLRWCLGITYAKRLKGGDLLDDIQTASMAMLKALPGAAAKIADRPDDEVPRCLKGYLENAIYRALLRARTEVVVEPYRSKHEVETSGRGRVRVWSLDAPVDPDTSVTDPDHGDTFADYVTSSDRMLPDGVIANAPYPSPDSQLHIEDDRKAVQALLDGAVPRLTPDERAVFTTMRGLVDGVERTAAETAHVLNLSVVRTRTLADEALKKVKAGALGERFYSAPEVINLDKAAEWKVRQGAKRAR